MGILESFCLATLCSWYYRSCIAYSEGLKFEEVREPVDRPVVIRCKDELPQRANGPIMNVILLIAIYIATKSITAYSSTFVPLALVLISSLRKIVL